MYKWITKKKKGKRIHFYNDVHSVHAQESIEVEGYRGRVSISGNMWER